MTPIAISERSVKGNFLPKMGNKLPSRTETALRFRVIDAFRASRAGSSAVWAVREDDRLPRLYPAALWPELRAAFPTRTKGAIEQRAAKLSIARDANRKPCWTTSEVARLRRLFPCATWEDVKTALSRHTQGAIRQRAAALGLARPPRCKLQSRYHLIRLLVQHRRQAHITRSALADVIGVSKTQIERWEHGLNVPRLPMLLDWVQALGLSVKLESLHAV